MKRKNFRRQMSPHLRVTCHLSGSLLEMLESHSPSSGWSREQKNQSEAECKRASELDFFYIF